MDNVSLLIDELKDSANNNYGKFPRNLGREFKKILNSYELTPAQLDIVNKKLNPIIARIKVQAADARRITVNELEALMSDFVEQTKVTDGTLISFDFKNYWRGNWNIEPDNSFGWDNALVINDPLYGRVLKVIHKSATSNAKMTPKNPGGLQFFNTFKEKYDHVSLEYKLKFQDDFRFCKGGRLPGLYAGEILTEDQTPNGTNGFLSKLAWTSNGYGELILNLPTMNGQHICSYKGGNWKYTPGKWHSVKQEIFLNGHCKNNGYVKISFDDKEVFTISDLSFRISEATKIKGVAFTNYYGESDPLALCPADTSIEFGLFGICQLKI